MEKCIEAHGKSIHTTRGFKNDKFSRLVFSIACKKSRQSNHANHVLVQNCHDRMTSRVEVQEAATVGCFFPNNPTAEDWTTCEAVEKRHSAAARLEAAEQGSPRQLVKSGEKSVSLQMICTVSGQFHLEYHTENQS